jgi:hypothetical protein
MVNRGVRTGPEQKNKQQKWGDVLLQHNMGVLAQGIMMHADQFENSWQEKTM